jgi:hypothetical protein
MLPIRATSLRQLTSKHTLRLMRSNSTSTSEKKTELSKPSSSQAKSDTQPSQETADIKGKGTTTGKKTMAQLDEELRLKMAGLAGDGGEAGVELEDGQPVSMKRSVKNNMFRYI